MARLAIAAFVAGLILVVFIDVWWGQLVGVLLLISCVVLGFAAVDPPGLARGEEAGAPPG